MSTIAKHIRKLVRELDFETDRRDLCDDELADARVAAQMLDHIIRGEDDARDGYKERAA